MAIQVSGTQVIGNSRELTNIASVDATTAASITAAGVGGGGTRDFVADGSITAGQGVGVTPNGKVSAVTGLTGSNFTFLNANQSQTRIVGMTSTKAVVIYANGSNIKGKVVTVGASTLSYGSEFTVSNSQGPGYLYAIYEPNSGKILVTWRHDANSTYYMKAVVVSISGTSGSVGSEVTVSTNPSYEHTLLPRPGNAQVAVCWRGGNPGQPGNCRLFTISGTSISMGSNSTTSQSFRRGAWTTSSRLWVLEGNYGRFAQPITLSGTTFSRGSYTDIYTGGWDYTEAWWDSTASKLVRVSADGSGFRMEAYTATTSIALAGTTLLTAPGEGFGGSNTPAYFSTALSRGIFKYKDSANSYLTKISVDGNNNPVFDSKITLPYEAKSFSDSAGNVLYTMVMASPDPVYAAASYVNFSSSLFSFVGFASNSVSDGQTVTVDIVGGENSSQSGLTIGSYYGISNGGVLTAGATPALGVATSATSILVQPGRS
tara:strand:+ start:893 stop:2353 length:1461 start_codon:yes stop_codon:yes gene_type:complete